MARNLDVGQPPPGARIFATLEPLSLESGETLPRVDVAYETFGTLNNDASNAVLICHALSGDSHVTQGDTNKPGWWDRMVGPGKGIDTDHVFVICTNVLGGCSGTTGPLSENPATKQPYGATFPLITIGDMVQVQQRVVQSLGIHKLAAVVGGSLGGMQALEWALRFPERVHAVACIASTAQLSAQAIAFNEIGRRAILDDPHFANGDYYENADQPDIGLSIARMIGHITYLSDESMWSKFGRRLRNSTQYAYDFVREFEVETYLEHQGNKFVERFDANTYIRLTKATDYFDASAPSGDLVTSLRNAPSHFLVTSVSSDWLFTTGQSRQLVNALLTAGKYVSFAEVQSPYGHDGFLLEVDQQTALLQPFITNAVTHLTEELGGAT